METEELKEKLKKLINMTLEQGNKKIRVTYEDSINTYKESKND